MKVLIAEDDRHTREGLAEVLEREGYDVVAVADGSAALESFGREKPDVICLDIMMPGMDGYEVCRAIRRDSDAAILFISAKSEEMDKVVGLELGADDFIMKPFGVREVVARIRAVTRRRLAREVNDAEAAELRFGDLKVLPSQLRARRGETVIELSLREVKILSLLHERKGEVVTRDQFFDHCWGFDHTPNSRTLDQHIAQLRKRIEIDPRDPVIIRTVHGAGYRFDG